MARPTDLASSEPRGRSEFGLARAGAIALLAGFAVMGIELTAVRLLAPSFGDSAYVWTNVIGVMLVALAAGAWLGGKWAQPGLAARRLALALAIGGGLAALVPLVTAELGAWLLPADLPLDQAMPALVRGSLAATLLVFAPSAALLGCATPMLVVAVASDGRVPLGRASGWVAMTSTLGSLVGTFATTHLLVPGLGSRVSVWVCTGAILAAAWLARPGAARAALLLLPLVLALVWSAPLKPHQPGQQVLAEVESAYQFLQVVREQIDGRSTTSLKINEGLDSFHSVAIEGTSFTAGRYYDYYAVVPFLVGDGQRPQPLRVASLGAAAGTFARLFAAAHPGCVVDQVEIDPAVVALGEQHFPPVPVTGRMFAGLDARVFVERAAGPYEVVLLDCYERQIYVPAHVASRQFFSQVRRLLVPGGVVAVNSGGRTFSDPVVQAIARTISSCFGEAWLFRVPRSRNFVVLGRRDRPLDPKLLRPELASDSELAAVLREAAFVGAWQRVQDSDDPLDDDRPKLDLLQHRSLTADLGVEGLTKIAGSEASDQAESAARRHLADERDFAATLAAVQRAAAATPALRLLAGDARWELHDLGGAAAEYAGGLQLGPDPQLGAVLEQRVAGARAETARSKITVAAELARRNAWVALAAAVGLAGIYTVLVRGAA